MHFSDGIQPRDRRSIRPLLSGFLDVPVVAGRERARGGCRRGKRRTRAHGGLELHSVDPRDDTLVPCEMHATWKTDKN